MVKPSHGSGWFEVVHEKAKLDRQKLIETCRSWLGQSFYRMNREWAYKNIVPRIIVQELIDDGTGPVPLDYRLYTFGGEPEFVIVDQQQDGEHRSRFFSMDWERLDVSNGEPDIAGDVPRPKHFDEMIAAAKKLARDIDFIRVDFFDTEEKLYFVELAWTPNCGWRPIEPFAFDRYLGTLWRS